jgi:hypothetical protein
MPGPKPRDIDERFWEKVRKEPGGCWIWTAGTDKDGYGMFQVAARVTRRAPKWIYERMVGPVPDGLHVCHHCDEAACVNYEKCLFIGTPLDNMRDRNRKGRQMKGGAHYAARVTAEQVTEMRTRKAAGESIYSFHGEYGLSYSAAKLAVSGKRWASLPVPSPS